MCLILFSYKKTPGYRLILAANRDEFLVRPTSPLGYFNESRTIVAGRDIRGGGTWLGVTKNGKIAGITNYRSPAMKVKDAESRGLIVSSYLENNLGPEEYLKNLARIGGRYEGFNLLTGDSHTLGYYSNATGKIRELNSGLYGLSNHLLDTPWPKVLLGKKKLDAVLSCQTPGMIDDLFGLLEDSSMPSDKNLPDTGVGLEWERLLSPIFISSPTYGTRSSAVLTITEKNQVMFLEKTFTHLPNGRIDSEIHQMEFVIDSAN